MKFSMLPELQVKPTGRELNAESRNPCGAHVKKKENDGGGGRKG